MSLHDLPAAATDASPRFYPVQFHPEFGYLAPTLRFRRKALLMAKGTAFGLIAGVIAAVAVSPERQTRVQSALGMLTSAEEIPARSLPSLAVPTLAMQSASVPVPSLVAPAAQEPVAVASEPKAAPKPKKKVVRPPRREPAIAEPDPRSAYAGPYRRHPEPQQQWGDRRPFGFGW